VRNSLCVLNVHGGRVVAVDVLRRARHEGSRPACRAAVVDGPRDVFAAAPAELACRSRRRQARLLHRTQRVPSKRCRQLVADVRDLLGERIDSGLVVVGVFELEVVLVPPVAVWVTDVACCSADFSAR